MKYILSVSTDAVLPAMTKSFKMAAVSAITDTSFTTSAMTTTDISKAGSTCFYVHCCWFVCLYR